MTATEVTITSRNHVSVVSVPMGGVRSVNGEHGDVVLLAEDIPFTPNGSIAATDVQSAIEEVRDEAGSSSGGTASGTTFTPTGTISSTDVQAALAEVSGDVTAEAAARASADSTNATAISTEATARASADTTLQSNITAEAATRASADTTNATAITTEATARATADALLAPTASPTFTGTVTVPSGAVLATPASLTLTNATGLPEAGVTGLTADLALKSPLASPTFTGHVTVPTPSSSTDAATKLYVDGLVSTVPTFRGTIDCSANPNYPAATGGDSYVVSVAGKIGGASGKTVVAGDVILASSTNAGGTEGSVGTSWVVLHSGSGAALTSGTLAQFAATTSAQLAGVISDETGSGALVFGTSPTLVTPALGTPSALTLTNATGLPQAGVTGLVTDLANRHKIGNDVAWNGASARDGLATDGTVYQTNATPGGTMTYRLPDSTNASCYDGQEIIISDKAGGASNATPIAITKATGSSDTITNSFYGPSLIGVFTPYASAVMKLDKPNAVWTAVNVFLDPDATMVGASDAVAPTQAAVDTRINNEIAALDTVSGGTMVSAVELAGNVTFDIDGSSAASAVSGAVIQSDGTVASWAQNITLPSGTFSSNALNGGKVTARSVGVIDSYTQSATSSDIFVGKGLYYNVKRTMTGGNPSQGAVGPADAGFGPGGIIQLSGTTTYNFNQSTNTWGGIGIALQHQLRTQPNTNRTMSAAWGVMEASFLVADGGACTLIGTDAGNYPGGTYGDQYAASFVDNRIFTTDPTNGGSWNGVSHSTFGVPDAGVFHVGYDSIPAFYGDTNMFGRAGMWIHDVSLHDILGVVGEAGQDGSVCYNVGVQVDRLRAGTVLNYGIQCNSPVILWSDTNDQTSNNDSRKLEITTAPGNVIDVGGTTGSHVLNYSAPSINQINLGATWTFKQRPSAIGGLTGVLAHPTITHDASLNGASAVIGTNTMFSAVPTYTAVTSSGNVIFSALWTYAAGTVLGKSGAGTLTVTSQVDFQSNLTVNAGVTVTTRTGLKIGSFAGSGTVQNVYGVDIDALSASTSSIGIRNQNPLINTGTVYGSEASGGNLTLTASTNATKGDIRLANPQTEWIVTDYTHTTGNLSTLFADATVTMNASGGAGATGNQYIGQKFATTVVYWQAGNVLGNHSILDTTTVKNKTSTALDLGLQYLHRLNPTYTADTAAVTSTNIVGIQYAATLAKISTGTLGVTNYIGLAAAGPIITTAGVTVTNRYGVYIEDTSLSAGGVGAVTNNIGVEILSQTGGATLNIGLRNASNTVFSPKTKTITATTDAITVNTSAGTTATYIALNNTSGSSKTLASTPTITAGQAGQILFIENTSAQAVVFQRESALAGSKLRLGAASRTLNQYDTLTLMYDGSYWVEFAFVDNT